jgi:hypothetical protein
MKLVKQLEMHPNCQLMAKLFYQMAWQATNTQGQGLIGLF